MPFKFDVPMVDGSVYKLTRLFGKAESNTKLAKSDKAGTPFRSYGLSMAPSNSSGFNLCTSASAACIKDCLFTSGFARLHPRRIQPARIAKSRMLRLFPEAFKNRLVTELTYITRTAKRRGYKVAVRLNVFSDVMWEREFPNLFNLFPNVQFYDYTKHAKRMQRFISGQLPSNYHLTFSWSGVNMDATRAVLDAGYNVAVPFDVKYHGAILKPLPTELWGHKVIDGDLSDLRFLDPQDGCIVGLRAKGEAKKDKTSGFVIAPTERSV